MGRLPGFDYSRPYFYMVTIKRLPPASLRGAAFALHGAAPAAEMLPFSGIAAETGAIERNAVTVAFEREIAEWEHFWRSIESVSPYVIMPDHLHLLVKLAAPGPQTRPGAKPLTLPILIGDLKKRLRRVYWLVLQGAASAAPPGALVLQGAASAALPAIFADGFHDWIVKKEGQLAAFRAYIAENGPRAALRARNRRFFTKARRIAFKGAQYWAYGNEALLSLPEFVSVKGHRRPPEAGRPAAFGRAALLAAASRIGPGGAGVSTFLSPLEKAAGNAVIRAGGSLVVLSATGFGERWHPTAKQEKLCAEGRMLYLSPWEPQEARLDKATMYKRAHFLVDWALEHTRERIEAWPI